MKESIKIAICGSQHSGKTTLLNFLKIHPKFRDYTFFGSASRQIKTGGGNVNREVDVISQYQIFDKHWANLATPGNCIFDRSLLDAVAYASDACDNNIIPVNCLSYGMSLLKESMNTSSPKHYDYVFYLEPIANMEEDGVRDTNESYRSAVIEKYFELRKKYNVYTLSGEIEDRISKLVKIVYG